ncbi:hypothetical protein [Caballeronia sp. BR00000012568055]|nr:hypothetical protein [Caballeronia sp. BR00000012568055]
MNAAASALSHNNAPDALAIGGNLGPMTGNASIPAIGPFYFIVSDTAT